MHPIAKTSATGRPLLARLEKIALAFPEAQKLLNHGRPSFAVNKKTFVMFMDNHHSDGRIAIWCKAPPGDQADMVETDPNRFFIPPYVGPRGWIGARLDTKPNWKTIESIVRESWRLTAPKRLLRSP
jgi:hypothetical protein